MPSTVEDRLRNILEAITEVEELVATGRMATECYLEIVCEAVRKLTDDVKRDAPDIEWQKMVDFGNVFTARLPCNQCRDSLGHYSE